MSNKHRQPLSLLALAQPHRSRGQSLVELALFLPILLMLLGGLVEFGFALNQYINVVEAVREGARAGVDGDPAQRDLVAAGPKLVSRMDCDGSITGQVTRDYYAGVACRVISSARPLIFNPVNEDDIVITVVRVYHDPLCDVTPVPPATAIPDADCHANILPDPHGAWPWWTPVPRTRCPAPAVRATATTPANGSCLGTRPRCLAGKICRP